MCVFSDANNVIGVLGEQVNLEIRVGSNRGRLVLVLRFHSLTNDEKPDSRPGRTVLPPDIATRVDVGRHIDGLVEILDC